MKIIWQIESEDITKVNKFVNCYRDNPFVQHRIKKNLSEHKDRITIDDFWDALVSCLLTTQQRSGPDSMVSKFIRTDPFPLNYGTCSSQDDLWNFSYNTLTDFGGIRRTKKLSDEIVANHSLLQQPGWHEIKEAIEKLQRNSTAQLERSSAEFIP